MEGLYAERDLVFKYTRTTLWREPALTRFLVCVMLRCEIARFPASLLRSAALSAHSCTLLHTPSLERVPRMQLLGYAPLGQAQRIAFRLRSFQPNPSLSLSPRLSNSSLRLSNICQITEYKWY